MMTVALAEDTILEVAGQIRNGVIRIKTWLTDGKYVIRSAQTTMSLSEFDRRGYEQIWKELSTALFV